MASGEGRPDSTPADQVIRAAVAAKEEILARSTVDALMNVRPEDLVEADPHSEVIKGPANRSGGWLHAPAHLALFAAADKRLTRVAHLDHIMVKKVERVLPKLIKGTRLLVIKAAQTEDLSAIPVNRYGASPAFINLISLLGEAGETVETGYRERFEVAYIPKSSPLYPGLVIDLSQPKERRQAPTIKKSNTKPTQSTTVKSTAKSDNTKSEAA
jgi:hypothetical protein